ncbi:MAG: hypothetical protein NTW29_03150 [Bacteroidetes bacterium]|nr:hypothetical protein [Bacteroidota bacterium]
MYLNQRIYLLFIPILLLTTISCNRPKKDKKIIAELSEKIKELDLINQIHTSGTMADLSKATYDWSVHDNADVWHPKAEKIADRSKEIKYTISQLLEKKNIPDTAVTGLITTLLQYKKDILESDENLYEVFKDKFDFISLFLQRFTGDSTGRSSSQQYNDITYNQACLTLLHADVSIIEGKLIAYCNQMTGPRGCILTFDTYAPTIIQNSKVFLPGEELVIKAGISAYSRNAAPKISLDGRESQLGPEGYVRLNKKVPDKPGIYAIPASIRFMNQVTGKEEYYTTHIKYTVVAPCKE